MDISIKKLKDLIKESYEELYEVFDSNEVYDEKKFCQGKNETDEEYYNRLKATLIILVNRVNDCYLEYGIDSKWAEHIFRLIDV